MRNPLHGIGFSVLKKSQGLAVLDEEQEKEAFTYVVTDQERQAFKDALTELSPLYTEMAELCYDLLDKTTKRFALFGNSPRSLTSTIFWPFVRINLFQKRQKPTGDDSDLENNQDPEEEFKCTMDRLQALITSMETSSTPGMVAFLETIHSQEKDPRYDLLYILFCYQMNLKTHCSKVIALAEESIRLAHDRHTRRLWIPSITLKKWFRTCEVDPQVGGDDINATTTGEGLIRTSTRPDALDPDNMATSNNTDHYLDTNKEKRYSKLHKHRKRFLPRDPDIYPPATRSQRFFFGLYRFKNWCVSINTFFAFKTAGKKEKGRLV